jgi:hypothetical protein
VADFRLYRKTFAVDRNTGTLVEHDTVILANTGYCREVFGGSRRVGSTPSRDREEQ